MHADLTARSQRFFTTFIMRVRHGEYNGVISGDWRTDASGDLVDWRKSSRSHWKHTHGASKPFKSKPEARNVLEA